MFSTVLIFTVTNLLIIPFYFTEYLEYFVINGIVPFINKIYKLKNKKRVLEIRVFKESKDSNKRQRDDNYEKSSESILNEATNDINNRQERINDFMDDFLKCLGRINELNNHEQPHFNMSDLIPVELDSELTTSSIQDSESTHSSIQDSESTHSSMPDLIPIESDDERHSQADVSTHSSMPGLIPIESDDDMYSEADESTHSSIPGDLDGESHPFNTDEKYYNSLITKILNLNNYSMDLNENGRIDDETSDDELSEDPPTELEYDESEDDLQDDIQNFIKMLQSRSLSENNKTVNVGDIFFEQVSERVTELDPVQVTILDPEQVTIRDSEQDPEQDPERVTELDPEQDPELVTILYPEQDSELVTELDTVLDPVLDPEQVTELNSGQVSELNPGQVSELNPGQVFEQDTEQVTEDLLTEIEDDNIKKIIETFINSNMYGMVGDYGSEETEDEPETESVYSKSDDDRSFYEDYEVLSSEDDISVD